MNRTLCLALLLSILTACGAEPLPEQNSIATDVAEARAVAATLTHSASAERSEQMPSPSTTPDMVATGVAVQMAIAATLTAGMPTPTLPPVQLPTHPPDAVATGVAVQKAIAATLTASAPTAAPALDAGYLPTATPTPSASITPTTPPTSTDTPAVPACVSWLEAHTHIGSFQCICGTVTGTYDDPNSSAFFINFGYDRTGYYAVSFSHTFQGLEGRCIQICGTVDIYNGRPQTVVSDPNQIQEQPACP